jgi:uncharacterized protein YndB with AHSA1/START domain
VIQRSVTHATFVIDRTYAARPAQVFAAFADAEIKARWSSCHDEWVRAESDFRVGGIERGGGGDRDGPRWSNETLYHDIVPDQRIVFSYVMDRDGVRISASLTTIEFRPDGAGTRLVLTEMGAYFDGHDIPARREHGTREGLEALGAELARQAADA